MVKKKALAAATKTAATAGDGQLSRQSKVVEVIEQPHAVLSSEKPDVSVTTKSFTPLIFKLPAEIRVRIWKLVVASSCPIQLSAGTIQRLRRNCLRSGKDMKAQGKTSPFAVVMTCRLVYLEATPIYYSGNMFCLPREYGVTSSRTFSAFLETIGKGSVYLISHYYIGNTLNNPAYVFDQLPRLKTLDVAGCHASAIFLRKLKKLCEGNEDLVIRCEGQEIDFAKRTPG